MIFAPQYEVHYMKGSEYYRERFKLNEEPETITSLHHTFLSQLDADFIERIYKIGWFGKQLLFEEE